MPIEFVEGEQAAPEPAVLGAETAGAAPAAPKKAKPAEDMTGVSGLVNRYLGKDAKVEVKKPAPAKKKAAPAPAAAAAPLDAAAIAAASAQGVVKAMAERDEAKKEEADKAKPDAPELSAEDKRKVEVLQAMEKEHPEEYKGLADKYQTSMKKLAEYAAKWEEENQGQAFDEASPEHEDFFRENDVDWDDDHYTEALTEIKARKLVENSERKTQDKLRAIEDKDRLRESAPAIARAQVTGAREYWQKIGGEYAELVAADGTVDQAKVKELMEADPVGAPLRIVNAQDLALESAELFKIMVRANGEEIIAAVAQYDEKNPVHAEMGKFVTRQETAFAALPGEDQLNEKGQRFATWGDYIAMPKAERKKFWTLSSTDLIALRANELAAETEKRVAAEEAKLDKIATAKGYRRDTNGQRPPPAEEAEPAEEPTERGTKPHSPASGAAPRLAAAADRGKEMPNAPLDSFVKGYIGRR